MKPGDTVFVAPEAATPATRRERAMASTAANAELKKQKKHRKGSSEESTACITVAVGESEPAPAVPPKAPSRRTRTSKAAAAAKAEAEGMLAPSLTTVRPGAADTVRVEPTADDTIKGLMRSMLQSILGSASRGLFIGISYVWLARLLAIWLASWAAPAPVSSASWSPSAWAAWTVFARTIAPKGKAQAAVICASVFRDLYTMFESVSRSHVVALVFLSFGPIIYLMSSFYGVPLLAVMLSEGLKITFDLSTIIWGQGFYGHGNAIRRFAAAVRRDLANFVLTSLFAVVLYSFTLVQACRFFLPTAFVLHFQDIATVKPARLVAPTLHKAYSVVYMGVPALALTAVCGVAARIYIFGVEESTATPRSHATYVRTIAVRTVCLSLTVGLSIFTHCYMVVPGVDAIGAASYASIWAVAPLLVGISLGLVGV